HDFFVQTASWPFDFEIFMVSFLAVIVIKFLWETVKEFPRRRSIVSSHTLLPISVTSVSAGALSANS
ncbi:hypothetical protein, partial [Mesotoga prima]|uniref:hypothetical protein n=1 Tax=Mesotoga prima TaxID=1184387 RepID=UPI002D1D8E20